VQASLGGENAGIESVSTHASLSGRYTASALQTVVDNNNWATVQPPVQDLPLSGDYPLHVIVNIIHTTNWEILPAPGKRKRATKIAYPQGEELKQNSSDKDDPSSDGGGAPKRGGARSHQGGSGGGRQGLSV
jgi:hypothetical protein